MAVGDIYRLKVWVGLVEGNHEFDLFYRESTAATVARPSQSLVDAFQAHASFIMLDMSGGLVQNEVLRAWRILPRQSCPAQKTLLADVGLVFTPQLCQTASVRFVIRSSDPSVKRANWWKYSAPRSLAAGPVTWSETLGMVKFNNFAAATLTLPPAIGNDGVFKLQHMQRSADNGVNTYGTPTDAIQHVADPTIRIDRELALPKLGAKAPLP